MSNQPLQPTQFATKPPNLSNSCKSRNNKRQTQIIQSIKTKYTKYLKPKNTNQIIQNPKLTTIPSYIRKIYRTSTIPIKTTEIVNIPKPENSKNQNLNCTITNQDQLLKTTKIRKHNARPGKPTKTPN